MSNIDLRYTVGEVLCSFFSWDFNVWDQKEEKVMCLCRLRSDAGMIAGLLNAEEMKKELVVDEDGIVR